MPTTFAREATDNWQVATKLLLSAAAVEIR